MRALHSATLALEPLVEAHAEEMFTSLSDPRMYAYMPGKPPVSVAALRERYRKLESRSSPDGRQRWLNWIVRVEAGALAGRCTGFVQATIHPGHTGDFAFAFAPRYWGHGLAFEACSLAIPNLFDDFDVRALFCTVDPANARSLRLLQRLGFEDVAPARYPHGTPEPADRVLERVRR